MISRTRIMGLNTPFKLLVLALKIINAKPNIATDKTRNSTYYCP